jgi:hypothetical protein
MRKPPRQEREMSEHTHPSGVHSAEDARLRNARIRSGRLKAVANFAIPAGIVACIAAFLALVALYR